MDFISENSTNVNSLLFSDHFQGLSRQYLFHEISQVASAKKFQSWERPSTSLLLLEFVPFSAWNGLLSRYNLLRLVF